MIRRPPLARELEQKEKFCSTVRVDAQQQMITVGEDLASANKENEADYDPGLYNSYNFTFDKIFDEKSEQESVYEHVAKPAVLSTLQVVLACQRLAIDPLCPGIQCQYHCIWPDWCWENLYNGRLQL